MRHQNYDRGRWEVERERHRIQAYAPPDAEPAQAGMDQIVNSVLHRIGLRNESWLRQIESKWGAIVGSPVATHARPGRYDRGILVIFVDSSAWLSELSRFWQKRILENLQKEFPKQKINGVRFAMDPEGNRKKPV